MVKIGDRVGAIFGASNSVVEFLGYGVYAGEEVPTEAVGGFGKILSINNIKNPKIQLDNGGVVFGCECWWGPEEAVKERLAKYETVTNVDINEVRKEHQEKNDPEQKENKED